MWDQAQVELAIEYDSAFDDHHERWVGEELNPEYEAYCNKMNAWDPEWPLEEMEGNEMAANELFQMAVDHIASESNQVVALVDKMPKCDFDHYASDDLMAPLMPAPMAKYDAKTKMGPWAYMCGMHYVMHTMYKELGTGKGQSLEERS